MRRKAFLLGTIILAAASMAACRGSTQGPTTWMDRPLDGQHLPLAALTIQAHASDEDGVGKMQFFIADSLLAEAPASGQRLSNASVDWMPPGPGTYVVSARAIDGQGNYGPSAHVQIFVGGSAGGITATPYVEPATGVRPLTATPATAVGPLPPAPAAAQGTGPSLSLTQNANCRTGPGTAYDNVDTLFEGQVVAVEGRNEQNTWFMVRKSSGSGTCWVSIVSVVVQGDLDRAPIIAVAAPVVPPPGGPAVPPEEVQDTTPPSISNVSVDPTTIQKAGCGAPDTFNIRATVTDASGVGNVTYQMHGPGGQGGEWYLQPVGGDQYQATGGPISGDPGIWSISIQATDMSNNTSQAGPWTIQVMCIE